MKAHNLVLKKSDGIPPCYSSGGERVIVLFGDLKGGEENSTRPSEGGDKGRFCLWSCRESC